MLTWLVLGLAVAAEPGGISIDPDAFAFGDSDPTLCWLVPRKLPKKTRVRVQRAMVRAAKATMPVHQKYQLAQIRSLRRPGVACEGILRLKRVRTKKGRLRVVAFIRRVDERKFRAVGRVRTKLSRVKRQHLEPVWTAAWRHVAPPPPAVTTAPPRQPPPAAEPAPAEPTPYVDQELATEGVVKRLAPPPSPRRRPWVSAAVDAGWAGRRIVDGPTADVNADVPTLGLWATMHVDALVDWPRVHALDVRLGYWRQFVQAQRADERVGVDADRTSLEVAYGYRLGRWLPRVGPVMGFELSRFESEAEGVLSTRFSVLRVGAGVAQPILQWEDATGVEAFAQSNLRWSPGGDAGLGVDADAGFALRLAFGLIAKVHFRFSRQSGEAEGATFNAESMEALAGVGWSL